MGPSGPSPGSATEKGDFSVSDTGGSEKKDKFSVGVGVEPMTLGFSIFSYARPTISKEQIEVL